jgi:hypothetical protein
MASLFIVTSHWKEDLTWLTKSPFPVILIDKEGAAPSPLIPQHIIPNKGQETPVYLKYIIENYDTLPDFVAFIHGHENAWHHGHINKTLLEVIAGANISKYDFIPLNNYFRIYAFKNTNHFASDDNTALYFEEKWDRYNMPQNLKPVHASPVIAPISAQFIVSKRRILMYSKETYMNWYTQFINDIDTGNNSIGVFFEYIWHILFGEPPRFIYPKDMFTFECSKPTICLTKI